jgi:hypothetical protein
MGVVSGAETGSALGTVQLSQLSTHPEIYVSLKYGENALFAGGVAVPAARRWG